MQMSSNTMLTKKKQVLECYVQYTIYANLRLYIIYRYMHVVEVKKH